MQKLFPGDKRPERWSADKQKEYQQKSTNEDNERWEAGGVKARATMNEEDEEVVSLSTTPQETQAQKSFPWLYKMSKEEPVRQHDRRVDWSHETKRYADALSSAEGVKPNQFFLQDPEEEDRRCSNILASRLCLKCMKDSGRIVPINAKTDLEPYAAEMLGKGDNRKTENVKRCKVLFVFDLYEWPTGRPNPKQKEAIEAIILYREQNGLPTVITSPARSWRAFQGLAGTPSMRQCYERMRNVEGTILLDGEAWNMNIPHGTPART